MRERLEKLKEMYEFARKNTDEQLKKWIAAEISHPHSNAAADMATSLALHKAAEANIARDYIAALEAKDG